MLRAAIALADEGGIESLSMRKLGQELGVEAMSLYNHVANKDDLLDGIVELVLARDRGALRRGRLEDGDPSNRDLVTRGVPAPPLGVQPDDAKSQVSPARMHWMEAVLRTLREAGFSADMTHHAYHALDSHITGFTLWQVSMPFETKAELVDMAEGFLRQIPADEYPYVIEHAEQHLAPSSPDGATEFEFGLDLILDGLERFAGPALS